jgi:hypothetical protein
VLANLAKYNKWWAALIVGVLSWWQTIIGGPVQITAAEWHDLAWRIATALGVFAIPNVGVAVKAVIGGPPGPVGPQGPAGLPGPPGPAYDPSVALPPAVD